MATSEQYYNSPEDFGNYQHITLQEIVNNYMMSRDGDDYTAMVPRFKVLYQARRGFREFYSDVVKEVRAIELELSPSLMVTLPPDFVNYVRISWVGEDNQLHPMAEDRRMSIAQEYLQDDNYNLLFDDEGEVLQGTSTIPMDDYEAPVKNGYDLGPMNNFVFSTLKFDPNTDLSRKFPNGRYKINRSEGFIQFGSDAESKIIVLEYISDGLFTGSEGLPEDKLRIHKFAESGIVDFIHHQLIKNRRNVPQSEKMRARKEFYNSRRLAMQRINTIRKDELLQVFKGSSVWIK